MTANAMEKDLELAREAGMVGHVSKPIDPAKLYRTLAEMIRPNPLKPFDAVTDRCDDEMHLVQSIRNGDITSSIGSQRKTLTVFFSDIQGFTAQTERMDPDDMSFLLNRYFDVMTRIVHEFGGTLDKYIGDAMLVFFRDPDSLGLCNDALACLRMAIAMQSVIDELQEVWQSKNNASPLRVRMGISTGPCTVGNFGSSTQHAYTILGTPVNLAARIQALADPGTIWISEATSSLVQNDFPCLPQAPVMVKGLSFPVQTYQVARQTADSR